MKRDSNLYLSKNQLKVSLNDLKVGKGPKLIDSRNTDYFSISTKLNHGPHLLASYNPQFINQGRRFWGRTPYPVVVELTNYLK